MSASRSGHAPDVRGRSRPRPWPPSRALDDVSPAGARSWTRPAALVRAARATLASSFLLLARVLPDLDLVALSSSARRARRRPRRRPADAVAGRFRVAEQPRTLPMLGGQPTGVTLARSIIPTSHRVDQAVLLGGRRRSNLAADRLDADRVPVVAVCRRRRLEQVRELADSANPPPPSASSPGSRSGPRAEREHFAQDPADPVCGALESRPLLGWLWPLKADQRGSLPTATAPAFSAGARSAFAPSSRQRSHRRRECL